MVQMQQKLEIWVYEVTEHIVVFDIICFIIFPTVQLTTQSILMGS